MRTAFLLLDMNLKPFIFSIASLLTVAPWASAALQTAGGECRGGASLHALSASPAVSSTASVQAPDTLTDTLSRADSLALLADSLEGGHELTWQERLRLRLSAFQDEAEAASYQAGICIYDLTGDSLLFAYHDRKIMRPASTQKILTAVSALDILGASHRFMTRAYTDGNIETVRIRRISDESGSSETVDSVDQKPLQTDSIEETRHVLRGNVYVVGGFDPLFSYDDLKSLARALKEQGIDAVDGHIVGDVSMKDTLQLGNGWCWDDVPSELVPYLSPLMFNHARSVTGRSRRCLPHPERYFVETLVRELNHQGVDVALGATQIRHTQTDLRRARLFYTQSHTLDQVLHRMMKNSDNLHAEAVFYQLAARNKPAGATWKDGARQVEGVVNRAGASSRNIEVADGSGLSLYNYVSPSTEVALLRYAYRHPRIYESLSASLPLAGADGTLSSRMRSGAACRNVRAKTGTLEGVSTLAGYVRASNGNLLAFSIMVNGVLKNAVGHSLQDRICQALAQ